jgi:SNF family Na+-dependent transporter
MEMATTYSSLLSQNTAIWWQAITVGVLVVGSSSLIGFMVSSTVAIFKMIADGR